ncbi:hypothetical protein LWI29_033829 [Acer saccharum]|uniref:Disease resistance protein At4g27190-like leucine-rich repeats domain-containing protein n=1 Tax=Acer saccharum TaxID=4024 RepID=A0AA39SVY8_ACESA|nr:hypothetical protein LWI29_033829 [Acer saccharum]
MDLVSPVVDVFNRVWDCIVKHSYPIRHLRENMQSLEEAKHELEAISGDVESNVSQLEEQQHSRRTNQVQNWLETVDLTLKDVGDILQRGDQVIKKRCLEECTSLVIDISSSTMKRMKILQIIGCNSLKELRFCGTEDDQEIPNNLPSLEYLHLSKCPIKDLTWLMHVPSLSLLKIGDCPSLIEVIACDFGSSEIKEAIDIFPNLENMTLIDLPNLKSICRQAMPFPSLESMDIWNCQNLRNLPFNSETVKTSYLNEIAASEEWWHQLEWGDEATKHHFTSKFSSYDGIFDFIE